MLGKLSRRLNMLFKGQRDETLCSRWARVYGSDCLMCRMVGLVLRDRWHCLDELLEQLKRDSNDSMRL